MPSRHPLAEASASSRLDSRPCGEETKLEGGGAHDHCWGPDAAYGEKLGCAEADQVRAGERFGERAAAKEGKGDRRGKTWGGGQVNLINRATG